MLAYTDEKVYIIAGPEFGELEGHLLIIVKALYGLRTSGARWHDRLSDCLRDMGFKPCKAEPDIWMRKKDNLWEYIGVYVDDLALAMKDAKSFIDQMKECFKFCFKGVGPIAYHLGMDFFQDEDDTLCLAPKKYLEWIIANYKRYTLGVQKIAGVHFGVISLFKQ